MPKIVKQNIYSFLVSLCLFILLIVFLQIFKDTTEKDQQINYETIPKYMSNIHKLKESEIYNPVFSRAISGDVVMVFGSSELTTSTAENIPYNFLNSEGVPTVGFGHAYFELLAIYGYLTAYQDHLSPDSKIVIILSPGWFNTTDLMPQAFIEHFPPDILRKVIEDSKAKAVFRDYVERNAAEFENVGNLRNALDTESFNSWISQLNLYLYSLKEYWARYLFDSDHEIPKYDVQFLNDKRLSCSSKLLDPHFWEKQAVRAQEIEFSKDMSEETLWAYKSYYERYLKDRSSKSYFSTLDSSLELAALDHVLSVLKRHDVKALFIMMPLNPYVYDDTDRFNPIAETIQKRVLDSGMEYLNLIETPYIPATLTDGMHMGELGWVKMNKAIVEYFCQ